MSTQASFLSIVSTSSHDLAVIAAAIKTSYHAAVAADDPIVISYRGRFCRIFYG
jgi:hypothetical protein